MVKLFISHASEDKENLVKPLVEKLTKYFNVWYDEYELKLGDSLRAKIDEGLTSCDFGVVVLSPAFFSKKWTQAELNGLFALEDKNRKIILPIWHNVTLQEVTKFSPIIADRLAVTTEKGLDRIVEEIRTASSVSSRAQEILAPNQTKLTLLKMCSAISGRELNEKILKSNRGYQLLMEAINKILDQLMIDLNSASPSGEKLFHPFHRKGKFHIFGPYSICVGLSMRQLFTNHVYNTEIVASVYKNEQDVIIDNDVILEEIVLKPTCINENEIGFQKHQNGELLTTHKVTSLLIDMICHHVTNEAKKNP